MQWIVYCYVCYNFIYILSRFYSERCTITKITFKVTRDAIPQVIYAFHNNHHYMVYTVLLCVHLFMNSDCPDCE